MTDVLDHGSVLLIDSMASDQKVTGAARVSTGKGPEYTSKGPEADEKLIRYLMVHGHGCFDEATEVLTRRGWLHWADATETDEFITLSDDDRLEWQRPQRLVRIPWDGPMVSVQGMSVDALVTPDHRMLAARRRHSGYRFEKVTAYDLTTACHRLRLGGGKWIGVEFDRGQARLLGLFVGDGYSNGSTPAFRLRKNRTIEALRRWTEEAGFRLSENGDTYHLLADRQFRQMAGRAYTVSREKCIPGEVATWAPDSIVDFLEGLIEADGHIAANGKITLSTTSWTLAGQVQELALKIGKAATVTAHPFTPGDTARFGSKARWRVTLYRQRNITPRIGMTQSDRSRQVTTPNYTGLVYCATVPNGTLYVRRNGKPMWSGNSPFEHAVFQFYVKAPIFVVREHQRHRVGSFNEQSGRYSEFKPEFYVPEQARVPDPNNKQSSVVGDAGPAALRRIETAATDAYARYQALMADGMAREMARIVLPLSLYTSYWWTVNARALMNFLALRNHPAAQWEMQEFARAIEAMFAGVMPLTHAAFVDSGRVAP